MDGGEEARTKLLLDGLENLFLVEFLWKTLDGGQRFATITLCQGVLAVDMCRTRPGRKSAAGCAGCGDMACQGEDVRWMRIWM